MTISTEDRTTTPKLGNGVWTEIPFTFKIFQTSEIVLKQTTTAGVESTLTEGAGNDYTVALNADQNSNPGGTITLTAVSTTGYYYTATSAVSNLQTTNITNLGGFFPATINNALDRLTILIQQVLSSVDRSIKIPLSDGTSITTELPTKTIRAGKVVGFDASGNVTSLSFADIGTDLGAVFSGLATNDFIQYDGADWVNITPAEMQTALSLASAAYVATGTSGATVPLLNANNTHSGNNTFSGTNTFSGSNTFSSALNVSGTATFTGSVIFANDGELTISSGAITPTGAFHTVDTQSDAASDDLDTINGGTDGERIYLRAAHTDRTVVIKDGTGNIETADGQDISLVNTEKVVTLLYDGTLTKWVVQAASIGVVTQFSDTEATIAAATPYTFAHGLGQVPDLFMATLVCTVTDLGYAVGDEIKVEQIHTGVDSTLGARGATVFANSTNVGVVFAAGYGAFNKSSGAFDSITFSSWDLKVKAVVLPT